MTFGLNFSNMFNMNTMMNLGSMVGMGGFGGFGGFGGCSTGINPFGSVFSFYGSGSGCCTPSYSTRTCSGGNTAWSGLGALLGYAGVALGTPLLIKGAQSLGNTIKESTNSAQQADAQSTLKDLEGEKADLLAELGKDEIYITSYDQNTDKKTVGLKDTYETFKGSYDKAIAAIKKGNEANASDIDKQAAKEAEDKLATLKEQMDDAEKEYNDYVTKMTNAKTKLLELNEKIKAEQEKLNDLRLDELDGWKLFSSDEKRLNTLFKTPKKDTNDTNKITGYDISEKVTDADFRAVIRGYKNANSDTDRKSWQVKFNALYEEKYNDNAGIKTPGWINKAYGFINKPNS